jgi:uncharacterized membrane protein YeaQ/YmgE (transglycosylase-associated protein family)
MGELELSVGAQHWVNVVLMWIGFGTIVGLLAKAILPGSEPFGAVATLTLGIVGSVGGLLVLSLILHDHPVNPISPAGILAATGATFLAMLAYRVFLTVFPPSAAAPNATDDK